MKSVTELQNQQRAITPRPQDQIIQHLKGFIEQVSVLRGELKRTDSSVFIQWKSEVSSLLRRVFGENTEEVKQFNKINYSPMVISIDPADDDEDYWIQEYQSGLHTAEAFLKATVQNLDKFGLPPDHSTSTSAPHITMSPTITNENHNSQSQSQHQELTVTLDQLIENATKQISESYGYGQAQEAIKKLETLKTDKKWETAKNIAIWFANLGKEAFIAAIPAIIKAVMKQ